MHALHLAIECRDGFGIRFSCRRDYNFHGQELGGQELGGQELGGQELRGQELRGQELGGVEPIPSALRDELSQTAVMLSSVRSFRLAWFKLCSSPTRQPFVAIRAAAAVFGRPSIPSSITHKRSR